MTKLAYRWTDNQSRLRVDRKLSLPTSEWSKVKLSPRWKDNDQSYLRVDKKPKSPTVDNPKYKSSYLRVDGWTKPLTSTLVRKNNFKSPCLRVDKWTNPLTSVLVKDLPTYRVTNEPSDPLKIINSNRNHWTKSLWWRTIPQRWPRQVAILRWQLT